MNKNIVLGIAGFGGLVIVGILLNNPNSEVPVSQETEEVARVTMPTNIPSFPIYPNTTLTNVRDSEGEDSRDISLSLSTTNTMKEIHQWYRDSFNTEGWSIKSDKNVAGYQIIQAEKENLYTSLQTANGTEPETVIISQHLKIRN